MQGSRACHCWARIVREIRRLMLVRANQQPLYSCTRQVLSKAALKELPSVVAHRHGECSHVRSAKTLLRPLIGPTHPEHGGRRELRAVHQPQKLPPHHSELVTHGGVEREHRAHRLHERQRRRPVLLLRSGVPDRRSAPSESLCTRFAVCSHWTLMTAEGSSIELSMWTHNS